VAPDPPVQSVQYKFDKTEYPLPDGQATATAHTEDSTMMDAPSITAGSISQLEGYAATIHQAVNTKLSDLETARQISDANFTSRMNEIDDSI
jgi:hypothetical protein